MTHLLIDGDILVYRCGFAAEKTHYLVEGNAATEAEYHHFGSAKDANGFAKTFTQATVWSRKEIEPEANALEGVTLSIGAILKAYPGADYSIFLTGKDNFRERLFPEYKQNRETTAKPKHYRALRNFLIDQYNAFVIDGIEADDAMAKAQTDDTVIVTIDKDLDQVPGAHYDWTTGEAYTVGKKEGMMFFYEQVLTGDSTDNIPGLKGVGPAKAKKILSACTTPKEAASTVHTTYLAAGHDNEHLDLMATLVWIQRQDQLDHPLWRHLK